MGTFILLKAMQKDKEVNKKIKKIISLSTPYRGSLWGNLLFWDNKRFMLKTNSKERNDILNNADLSKIRAFAGNWDELVVPCRNLIHDEIKTEYFRYGGHVRNLFKEESLKQIISEIGD